MKSSLLDRLGTELQALKEQGLENTPDGVKLHRQWANVTRKMNKLRLRLKAAEQAKERRRAEHRF